MTKTKVNAGACGFSIDIICDTKENGMISLGIKTDCLSLKNLEGASMEFDAVGECYASFGTGEVFKTIVANLSHISCPVITAALKSIEAEAGLSIAQNVSIDIVKN